MDTRSHVGRYSDARYDNVWRARYVDPEAFHREMAKLADDPRLDLMKAFLEWRAQRLDGALRQVLHTVETDGLSLVWHVRALNLEGVILGDLGLEKEALEVQLRELELAPQSPDPLALAIVTHNIGFTYRNGAPAQADQHLTDAIAMARTARTAMQPGSVAAQEAMALESLAAFNLATMLKDRGLAQRLAPVQELADAAWPDLGHAIRATRISALLEDTPPPTADDVAAARALAGELPDPSSMRDLAWTGDVTRARARLAVVDGDVAGSRRLAGDLAALAINCPPYALVEVLWDLSHLCESLGDLAGALDAARRRSEAIEEMHATNAPRAVRALEVWHRTQLARQEADTAQATLEHMRNTLHDLQRDRERLRASSHRDVLTGLWNRGHLLDVVNGLPAGGGHQVALIDIDRFKQINDTAGHAAGDGVLRRIADAVQDVCRPDDIAVRHGGDEFVVLRPAHATGRLADCLEPVTRLDAHPDLGLPSTSTSIGVAVMGPEDFASVLARADALMYEAKGRGGGLIVSEDHPPRTGCREAAPR